MEFRLYQVMADQRPLLGPIYQDDNNFVARAGWSWLEKDTLLPTISLDSHCIMLTIIWTVMARSRQDFGYSRLWLVEDL
jgi:hypothetical protein